MVMSEKQRFKEYAIGFNGFDGGNPAAGIWFCGIEPGRSTGEDFLSSNDCIQKDQYSNEIPYRDQKFRDANPKYQSWPYDRIVAQIMNSISRKYKNGEDYMEKKLYNNDDNCFKLNLYPLKIRGADASLWRKEYYEYTGFQLKELYWAWCMKNRFPVLQRLMQQHQPRVIVCTGLTWRKHFLLAFGSDNDIFAVDSNDYAINNGKTKLLITKFFSRRFYRDKDIDTLVERIRNVGEIRQ